MEDLQESRLTAAHALHLGDIDFVFLESRPTIFEDTGTRLINPYPFKVMYQLGVLNTALSAGSELKHYSSFTADGHVIDEKQRHEQISVH